MYRTDYILRLIERFGQALRLLRDRILRREVDGAAIQATLADAARQAGLDLDIARRLDPESLLLWLAPTGEIDDGRLWLMAELLYLSGLQHSGTNDASADADFTRALALLERLPPNWRPTGDFPTVAERIADIRARTLSGRG